MTDLVGFRSKVKQILGDVGATRYTDAVIDEGLRWALAAYGKALPQVKSGEVTVSTAGREQSLSTLSGLVTILEVNYPYTSGDEAPESFYAWHLYAYGGTFYVEIGGDQVPAMGEIIRVVYTTGQEIDNLDGATATTVITTHDYMLANGAAGKAAIMRASQLIEAYGSRKEEPERLEKWGGSQLALYGLELAQLKVNQAFPGNSADGWKLDKWDQ
jgi:hypothetical protein